MLKLNPHKPFFISPPFGYYFSHPNAYSVLGSYTPLPRPGRFSQIIKTVRPVEGGWLNKIGLRNPGMKSIKTWQHNQILSFAAITGEEGEWEQIIDHIRSKIVFIYSPHEPGSTIIEINISCPNTNHPVPMLPSRYQLSKLLLDYNSRLTTIFKLQPLLHQALDTAQKLADQGATYLHLSNTLPTPIGGISGKHLREANLPIVDRVASEVCTRYPNLELIAGGGIYDISHLKQYLSSGATRFSLATAFVKPWRGYKIINQYSQERECARILSEEIGKIEIKHN